MSETLRPLAPGYTPHQAKLDAEMVALGRPHLRLGALVSREALATHRAEVDAWELAHPLETVQWLERRAQQRTEEARLYAERFGPEAFAREQLRVAGFEEPLIAKATHQTRPLHGSACLSAARDWMLDGTTWCLMLAGPPGCGKTQAATWTAHQLLMRGFAPRSVQCLKRSEAPLYGSAAEEERWRCATAGALVLDDLGEGDQRNEKRSVWRSWLDDVLTQRYAEKRKTIITTNCSTGELSVWLGARIADRLNEGVIVGTNEPTLRGRREPGEDG